MASDGDMSWVPDALKWAFGTGLTVVSGIGILIWRASRVNTEFEAMQREVNRQRALNHWMAQCMVIIGTKLNVELPPRPASGGEQ